MAEVGVAETLIISALIALFFMRSLFSKEKSFTEQYKLIQTTFEVFTAGKFNDNDAALKHHAFINLIASAISKIANTLIVLTGLIGFWTVFIIANLIFSVK